MLTRESGGQGGHPNEGHIVIVLKVVDGVRSDSYGHKGTVVIANDHGMVKIRMDTGDNKGKFYFRLLRCIQTIVPSAHTS